jgi:hypothetical protein
MTPAEWVRQTIADIEAARAALDDCPAGLILHTPAFTRFVCIDPKGAPYLGAPASDHVAVFTTFARADTLKRYWNSKLPAEVQATRAVNVWPRREAITIYIQRMETALDFILTNNTPETTQ